MYNIRYVYTVYSVKTFVSVLINHLIINYCVILIFCVLETNIYGPTFTMLYSLHIIIINIRYVVVLYLYKINAHLNVLYKYKVLLVVNFIDRSLNNIQIIVNIIYYLIKKKNRMLNNFFLSFELQTPFKQTMVIMDHFRPNNYKSCNRYSCFYISIYTYTTIAYFDKEIKERSFA